MPRADKGFALKKRTGASATDLEGHRFAIEKTSAA
jgi:hypothetical protein